MRTGGYVDYGFGGFVYQRNGNVTLPATGQAQYTGDYGGVRVFSNAGGLEYVAGSMDISIDFDDFNDGAGVRGESMTGPISTWNPSRPAAKVTNSRCRCPVLGRSPGEADIENGEITGGAQSLSTAEDGSMEVEEEGTYYAILSGDTTQATVARSSGVIVSNPTIRERKT